MPAPVISTASGILSARRAEPWQFQVYASNTPTSWSLSSVPSEITISSAGLISCTGIAVRGPIVFTVTASNADGSSSQQFVVGISPELYISPGSTAGAAHEWSFDFVTRSLTASSAAVQSGSQAESVLARWGEDDRFILRLYCKKGSTQIDPNPTAVKLVTKDRDDEDEVTLASTFVRSVATGADAYFDLLVDFTDPAVKDVLSEKATNARLTKWQALVQVQIEYQVTFAAVLQTLRISSSPVIVELARDFVD